jgi:hypothetical protein
MQVMRITRTAKLLIDQEFMICMDSCLLCRTVGERGGEGKEETLLVWHSSGWVAGGDRSEQPSSSAPCGNPRFSVLFCCSCSDETGMESFVIWECQLKSPRLKVRLERFLEGVKSYELRRDGDGS